MLFILGSFLDAIEHWFENFAKVWGNNQLVAGIIVGIVIAIFGFLIKQFIPSIFRMLGRLLSWLWAKLRGQEADHVFEKEYLSWLVNQYRYLGLLPARILESHWGGERQRIVDLEKVYVSLSVSAQSGDENWAETYGIDEATWRKRPWPLSPYFRFVRWYYVIVFSLLILGTLASLFQAIWIGLDWSRTYLFQIAFDLSVYFWSLTLIIVGLAILGYFSGRVLLRKETYQPGDIGLAIDRHKRLVMRGDPGSGKSTLLKYLAVTCAHALRNDKSKRDLPRLVKERLLWNVRPFPILVTLRRYNDVASWGEQKDLTDAFREEIPPELRKKCPNEFFDRKLRKGNCLIMLDAFDELGSPEARVAMARRIAGFLEVYDRPDNRVVVTTRIVGYEGQLDQYEFNIRTVQNLKVGEIRALVKQRYRAIATSETLGMPSHEANSIFHNIMQRSERLIKKIESTPRLNQLATNPLLLSLIVLVHYVKIELPEERILLYRDCVDNLTEQWQRAKRSESGIQTVESGDLTLDQKLVLLQEIAMAMQKKREDESRQALLPRVFAQELIAKKLPDILGGTLPQSVSQRQAICRSRAEQWIKGIQVESGILVEQGLDDAGEPLVGFSHLTFQEYLAAAALNEDAEYFPLLIDNLLNPAWREVVLLYVALANDATAVIMALHESPIQPEGVLLAGYCLAEHVKRVRSDIQQLTLTKLKEGFSHADEQTVDHYGKVLVAIGGSEVTVFMRNYLHNSQLKKVQAAVRSLGQTRANDPSIELVRDDLVQLVEVPGELEVMIAARESLAQIGDPRFIGKEPRLIRIPQQQTEIALSPRRWKDLKSSPEWKKAKALRQRLPLAGRLLDRILYTVLHGFLRHQSSNRAFEIGKYPVTNIEYNRFIETTNYPPPKHWIEGAFPTEEATHPVTNVNSKDAEEYCAWLSRETGNKYRLPTEWEWEWAATGPQGWKYPWGDQFDKNKSNSQEAGTERTTPAGSYFAGTSQFGVSDMSGNVWEITRGLMFFSRNPSLLGISTGFLSLFEIITLSLMSIFFAFTVSIFSFPFLGLLMIIIIVLFNILLFSNKVLRGGAWNTPSEKATCFARAEDSSRLHKFSGFRCLKEI